MEKNKSCVLLCLFVFFFKESQIKVDKGASFK